MYSGEDVRFAIAEEALFKTPVADGAAMIELDCEKFPINPDKKHHAPPRAQGQLHPDISNLWNDSKGSIPTFTLKTIALKQQLAIWLNLLFQNVSEGATTPYQKVFTFPDVGPNFVANNGEFITVVRRMPVASVSEKITSAIVTKLDLSLNANADDGCLAISPTLIGMNYSRTANPSGAWAKTADGDTERFSIFDMAVCTLGGSAIVLNDFKASIECLWKPMGVDGAGGYQTYMLQGQSATLNISGVWDAVTRAGLTALDAGSEVHFVLGWGATGVSGYLNFDFYGIPMPGSAPVDDATRLVNLQIKCASNNASSHEAVSIALADAHDWGW
jgi:hypothetical protein